VHRHNDILAYQSYRNLTRQEEPVGLFDKVLGKKEQGPLTLNEREAFAAAALAAVAADGVIERDEAQQLIGSLTEKRLFKGHSLDDLLSLLNKMANLIQKRGVQEVIEAASKTLPAELRETAFALAADLVLADGVVEQEEKKFLEDFQKALVIKDELAVKIVEVMVVKNRG
jgi:tellurite resistance protein